MTEAVKREDTLPTNALDERLECPGGPVQTLPEEEGAARPTVEQDLSRDTGKPRNCGTRLRSVHPGLEDRGVSQGSAER